jgi:hypothetical protein
MIFAIQTKSLLLEEHMKKLSFDTKSFKAINNVQFQQMMLLLMGEF